MLKDCCIRPEKIRNLNRKEQTIQFEKYSWEKLKAQWDCVLKSENPS